MPSPKELKLSAKDKQLIIERLAELYATAPDSLREALPKIAEMLESTGTRPTFYSTSRHPFGLTERERASRQAALEQILRKARRGTMTRDEAIAGLEHGAALLKSESLCSQPLRQGLLKLARKASGIVPRKDGKPLERIVGEGSPVETVPVVKGVDLHLDTAGKLVSITMDPKQWRLRAKALGFIGIGSENATDVAARHDEYLSGGKEV